MGQGAHGHWGAERDIGGQRGNTGTGRGQEVTRAAPACPTGPAVPSGPSQSRSRLLKSAPNPPESPEIRPKSLPGP